jgi:hypothetical protein
MEATGKAWEEVVFGLLYNLHKLMTSGKNIFARKKGADLFACFGGMKC